MIAQQTFQPISNTPKRPIFQMFIRHTDDGTTLHTSDDYTDAMEARSVSTMKAWQLRQWNASAKRMVMIACSPNWFLATPAATVRWIENQQMEVVDGLMVVHESQRDYVYFTDTARWNDSHIKIYNRRSLAIVGDVTSANFDGFLKAAAVAKRYIGAA